MNKKKFYVHKLAAFFLAIAPFTIINSHTASFAFGEPELPAKYQK